MGTLLGLFTTGHSWLGVVAAGFGALWGAAFGYAARRGQAMLDEAGCCQLRPENAVIAGPGPARPARPRRRPGRSR